MSIAERLRSVLDLKKLTIKQASDLVGIPYRTLQNYLLEEREPNAKALGALRTHLGVSADWLLAGDGAMFTWSGDRGSAIAESPFENAILEGMRGLSDDDHKDLLRVVERMRRFRAMEDDLDELKRALVEASGRA